MNKSPISPDEQRWLDALAGKAKANDRETRQASQLREYFALQRKQEQNNPLDEQTKARIMNRLRADGVFSEKSPATNPLAQFWAWFTSLTPRQFGFPGAVVLAAFFAVMIAPKIFIENGTTPQPDDGIVDKNLGPEIVSTPATRGLPPSSDASATDGASSPNTAHAGERSSTNPKADSTKLVQTLAAAGITATRTQEGKTWLVQAQIPPERVAEVNEKLKEIGMAAPDTGALLIRFKNL